mmetsp:Transcript_43254/g.94679  ORF Transcript_43254/g.94679 Transcript_43254/m.94679 type:complete len:208 (+) Transcript_43254:64-687(+)
MEQHSLVILLPARRLLQALLDLVSDVDELLARGSDAKGAAEGVVEVDADAGRRDERARQDREEETQLQRGEEAEQVLVGGDQKGDNDRSAQQAEHHPMYSRKSGLQRRQPVRPGDLQVLDEDLREKLGGAVEARAVKVMPLVELRRLVEQAREAVELRVCGALSLEPVEIDPGAALNEHTRAVLAQQQRGAHPLVLAVLEREEHLDG